MANEQELSEIHHSYQRDYPPDWSYWCYLMRDVQARLAAPGAGVLDVVDFTRLRPELVETIRMLSPYIVPDIAHEISRLADAGVVAHHAAPFTAAETDQIIRIMHGDRDVAPLSQEQRLQASAREVDELL